MQGCRDGMTVCECEPQGVERCGYRVLADAIIWAFNPRDGEEDEESICVEAVDIALEYITAQPCQCPPGAATYDAEPCGRCRALGQRAGAIEVR